MRIKTISRLRSSAVAVAAASLLGSHARADELEGPSRIEGPVKQRAPAKAPEERPAQPAPQGETRPQRVVQPERPEGKLVMPRAAEEKGMQVRPDTPDVYVIEKGDTLWDLSQKFLNNPWYWPKIWSLNAYIENPHWIYPGNKLKIIPGQGGPQAPAQVEPEPTNDERPQSEIANQVDTTPPEAADLADAPQRVGRLTGRRAERYLRPLLHPSGNHLLGFPTPTVPYWTLEGDRPSVALLQPDAGPAVKRTPAGFLCRFAWRGADHDLPLDDAVAAQRLERSGATRFTSGDLCRWLGFRPHLMLVAFSPPHHGNCYKVVAALLPRP